MHAMVRPSRRGAASAVLLIVLTAFGVLLMHSVTPTASMGSGHADMASAPPVDSAVPVASGEHDCPSAHPMMHPCVGTTVSWPALTVPAMGVEIDQSSTSVDRIGGRADSMRERAPPWTLWELDRSVTLRV